MGLGKLSQRLIFFGNWAPGNQALADWVPVNWALDIFAGPNLTGPICHKKLPRPNLPKREAILVNLRYKKFGSKHWWQGPRDCPRALSSGNLSVLGVQSPCQEQITSITSTKLSSLGLSIGVTIMYERARSPHHISWCFPWVCARRQWAEVSWASHLWENILQLTQF